MTTFAEAMAEAENNHDDLLNYEFYFQYGAAAEQAGLTEKAAGLLKQSIELEPNNAAQAYNYLGYMWADRGEISTKQRR
jgi:tetratricopeptide (TPR) repeat protein